jgi:hypothetical protein
MLQKHLQPQNEYQLQLEGNQSFPRVENPGLKG